MSIPAFDCFIKKSRAQKSARLVMMSLAWHANEQGWAWPSQETIKKETHLGRTAISQGITSLVKLGEVHVDEHGGPNLCNRYLLLLFTNGRITNPLPDPDDLKDRRHVRSANTSKPGIKTGHNKSGQNDIESRDFPEWPSEDDVLAFAKAYQGSMAKGIPAVIPESWARYHFHFNTYQRRQWAPEWKKAMVSLFELRWQDGDRAARGQPKKTGVWELRTRLEELRKQSQQHCANESSSSYFGEPTDEEQQEYQRLLDQIKKLERQMTEGPK